jgi:hypothetical protein
MYCLGDKMEKKCIKDCEYNTNDVCMLDHYKNHPYKQKCITYIKTQNKTIKIEVWGGCVTDVKNLPRGWKYEIVDRDVTEEA